MSGRCRRTSQFNPVSDRPVHVDFLRISVSTREGDGQRFRSISIDEDDASPGIKRGGVLNIVRHELELTCDAAEIPDEIRIST